MERFLAGIGNTSELPNEGEGNFLKNQFGKISLYN